MAAPAPSRSALILVDIEGIVGVHQKAQCKPGTTAWQGARLAITADVNAATRGRELRSFSVRKEAKDHGVTGRLAGALQRGDRVVITEDTTTRGTSLMEAVEVVREFGCEVVLVTLIVDRGDTCAALCAAAGVTYRPLLTSTDLGFGPDD